MRPARLLTRTCTKRYRSRNPRTFPKATSCSSCARVINCATGCCAPRRLSLPKNLEREKLASILAPSALCFDSFNQSLTNPFNCPNHSCVQTRLLRNPSRREDGFVRGNQEVLPQAGRQISSGQKSG